MRAVNVIYDEWTAKRREKAQVMQSTIRIASLIHRDEIGNGLNMQPWTTRFLDGRYIRGDWLQHAFVGYDYDEQMWLVVVLPRVTLPHIDLTNCRP